MEAKLGAKQIGPRPGYPSDTPEATCLESLAGRGIAIVNDGVKAGVARGVQLGKRRGNQGPEYTQASELGKDVTVSQLHFVGAELNKVTGVNFVEGPKDAGQLAVRKRDEAFANRLDLIAVISFRQPGMAHAPQFVDAGDYGHERRRGWRGRRRTRGVEYLVFAGPAHVGQVRDHPGDALVPKAEA
jgi:hypothetical protein